MAKTIISIPSTGQSYSIPQSMTEAQVRALYTSDVPAIGNMTARVTQETDADGPVTRITFEVRTGNKGIAEGAGNERFALNA